DRVGLRRVNLAGHEARRNFLRAFGKGGTAGNLTTDAHIAALAIEYEGEVATTDLDFGRFAGLKWFLPGERPRA
ncbi:MAG TPA: hypothetical protein VG345_12525, partial [Bryobacteraceae bacterium]|nr:hypothetical protein [Bryobacteraceae bacterium]